MGKPEGILEPSNNPSLGSAKHHHLWVHVAQVVALTPDPSTERGLKGFTVPRPLNGVRVTKASGH